MEGLGLVVVLGATIIIGAAIASRLRVAAPLVLLVLGAGLGFIPLLSNIQLPPDLVLLLFLPALLYWESLNTSLREIRANLRVISLLAIGLVFATAAVVALVGHAFGLSWPMSVALGAILAPTDATAVASIAGRLPRRVQTILRAESLVNDGTALVLYTVAVAAAVSGESVSVGGAALSFVLSYLLGLAIGLAVGFAVIGLRRILHGRLQANTISVLTPFLAYLPAEYFHVSGVVAVVACGLLVSQLGPDLITASSRAQGFGFWQLTTYLLNAALFVLIGLQLSIVVRGLDSNWLITLAFGLLCAVAVVLVRLVWSNTVPYVIRLLDRRPQQRTRRVAFRQRFPLAWAGFRGAVSLAAALALPTQTAAGDPLPGRDVVIAVSFCVILFTLLVQGLTLPALVRWGRLPDDPTEFDEQLLAEQTAIQAELDALDRIADELGTPPESRETVRRALQQGIERIHREEGNPALAHRDENQIDQEARLRVALVPEKRKALSRLRRAGRIDDVIHRRATAQIDLEELRFSSPVEDD